MTDLRTARRPRDAGAGDRLRGPGTPSAQADVARFVLDRGREDVARAAADPSADRELAHARARVEAAETWLRLSTGGSAVVARLDELGRVLCLLGGAYRDHPEFTALVRRWPALDSRHPLW